MADTPRRGRRILARVGIGLAVVLALLVAGTVVWSQTGVLQAEPAALEAARANPAVEIEEVDGSIRITPAASVEAPQVGLVFLPGGKVEAEAYVAKLARVAEEAGITVVITRPWLNLAFFDPRGMDEFMPLAPAVDRWLVGGHSLGGVRACSLAEDAAGLVLFASYCAADLSDSELPVLSLSGSRDALSTPEKVQGAADELPPGTRFVELDGANHAAFGDYGAQAGDGEATMSDDDVTVALAEHVAELVESL